MNDNNKAVVAYAKTLIETDGTVVRDESNQFFKSRYATLDAVQQVILPVLSKNKASFSQNIQEADRGINVETVIYHESGDFIKLPLVFMPVNKDNAQGYGEAHTYGRRYALLAQFHLAPADDDDDGNAAAKAPPPPKPVYDEAILEKFALCETIEETQQFWNEINKNGLYKKVYADKYVELKNKDQK